MLVGIASERFDGACRAYRVVADLIRDEPSAESVRGLRPLAAWGVEHGHDRQWARLHDALGGASLDELREAHHELRATRVFACDAPWAPSRRASCAALGLSLDAKRSCDLDVLASSIEQATSIHATDRAAAYDILGSRQAFLVEHAVGCLRPLVGALRRSPSALYRAAGDALAIAVVLDYRHAAPASGVHRAASAPAPASSRRTALA